MRIVSAVESDGTPGAPCETCGVGHSLVVWKCQNILNFFLVRSLLNTITYDNLSKQTSEKTFLLDFRIFENFSLELTNEIFVSLR